jgi:hypothetical protein
MTVLLVAALFLATSCQSVSLVEKNRTISVQGTGKVSVSPDIASFSITVSELGQTTAQAQQQTNAKIGTLLSFMRQAGIQEKDMKTTSLQFRPEYEWIDDKQVLVGQRVSQTLYVTVRGIDTESSPLASLLDAIGSVSDITMSSLSFSKEDPSAAYTQSRALAMEKAMQKASEYAQAAGMKLGKPLLISDQSISDSQISRSSTMLKASFDRESVLTEVPTGELLITSTVSVVFLLE